MSLRLEEYFLWTMLGRKTDKGEVDARPVQAADGAVPVIKVGPCNTPASINLELLSASVNAKLQTITQQRPTSQSNPHNIDLDLRNQDHLPRQFLNPSPRDHPFQRRTRGTMAATEADPLLLLRQSIASGGAIIPTTTADTSANAPEVSLSNATHLHFTHPARVAIPIDAPTRFESNGRPVDLRSIYFAWLNREVAIPEYNDSATKLNDDLAGSSTVHKFAFVERLDLITWLEGASEESEYIKPLTGDKDGAQASGAAAATTTSKTALTSLAARAGRGTLDPRLAQIYGGERRMGDRNTVLRGIKPTVCSLTPCPSRCF